ncbi:MAG: hypothetical protein FJW37_08920, partial [Acidobacteria bacterium]|nr:hypothetical protein [Acidobacteriota bacterium]
MRQWLLSLAAGLLLAQQPLALQPGRPAPSHRVTERSKGRIASPEQYIGAAACGACHPSQLARQSKTAHARALFPAPAHPLAGSFGFGRVLQRERYSFELSRSGGSLLMEIYDQESILKLPLDWAFGAGEHSVTFVSRIREDLFLEHAFSYYRKSGSFDLTPGHETAKVENLHQAAGLLYNIA